MAKSIFIDEQWLKENIPVSANVDINDVYAFVQTAQDRYVHETIGTSLYDYLMAQGLLSPQWPESLDQKLIEMIRFMLGWYTVYDFIPWNWVKVRNIGLVSQSGQDMVSASDTQMQIVRDEAKDKAVWYQNQIIEYLCQNGTKYSQYNKGCWTCGSVGPLQDKTSSIDLAFDRSNPKQDFYKKWL